MSKQEQLAKDCIKRAQATMGVGWQHISADLRWGLVAANILAIFDGQDEEIPAARVVEHTKAILEAAKRQMG